MSPLLALFSAVSYGAGDFLGGIATRRSGRVFSVVILSQLAGFTIILVALVLSDGTLIREDIGWAAGGGAAGSVGIVLLYRGLSVGTMSVVAPLSAIMTAVVPVAWGLISGERPSIVSLVGIPIALAAIWLVSGARPATLHAGPGLLDGIGAGVGFGVFFILVANSESAELWTLTFARVASISLLLLVAVATRSRLRPGPGVGWIIVVAGAIDMAANLLFLMAERRGLLTLVSVVSALYPASTVLLARLVLHEHLARSQWFGLVMAVVGVALISAG